MSPRTRWLLIGIALGVWVGLVLAMVTGWNA